MRSPLRGAAGCGVEARTRRSPSGAVGVRCRECQRLQRAQHPRRSENRLLRPTALKSQFLSSLKMDAETIRIGLVVPGDLGERDCKRHSRNVPQVEFVPRSPMRNRVRQTRSHASSTDREPATTTHDRLGFPPPLTARSQCDDPHVETCASAPEAARNQRSRPTVGRSRGRVPDRRRVVLRRRLRFDRAGALTRRCCFADSTAAGR